MNHSQKTVNNFYEKVLYKTENNYVHLRALACTLVRQNEKF